MRVWVAVAVLMALAAAPARAAEPMLGQDTIRPQMDLAGGDGLGQGFVRRDAAIAGATPRARCAKGSRPEGDMQGRVPADAPADGFACNISQLGHEGASGGFKVERFVDKAGHECAYYDTALVFPTNVPYAASSSPGTAVLDMTDPAHPVRTDTLATPAMQSPHESLLVNQRRGLLAAVMGNPSTDPGIVDLYDINADCRHPALQSSLPVGFVGHESGFTPDGNTFWATSLFTKTVTAVDVTNPKLPSTLWVGNYSSHGLSISDDGNRAYLAALAGGLTVLDVSEIQARKPNPQAKVISQLGWPELTIPQVALPVTINGTPYLAETDEFSAGNAGGPVPASNGQFVGAARLIDISDEAAPKVASNLRLAVNQPENRDAVAGDPGAGSPGQGYAAHYCGVPRERNPGIVACSFIASGLRVFDVRDPLRPRELAYFVAPRTVSDITPDGANYAMSRPGFDAKHGEVWYSDAGSGFYTLRVKRGFWPFNSGGRGLPSANRCLRKRVLRLKGGRRVKLRRNGITVVRRGRAVRRYVRCSRP
ncbi:MAG: hypothetical protein QOI80_3507 [Solirubrobacteraceae bacterium]|jgi:hypothetical protein|nr:hypothetical protein [Solirubrobacteraceae bacterium]